jgi:hypothetical protein
MTLMTHTSPFLDKEEEEEGNPMRHLRHCVRVNLIVR